MLHYGGVRFGPHPTRKFDLIRNERLSGLIAMEQGEIAKLKVAARLKKNANKKSHPHDFIVSPADEKKLQSLPS